MTAEGTSDFNHNPREVIGEHAQLTAELTQGDGVLATIAAIKLAGDPQLAERYGAGPHEPLTVYDITLARPEHGKPVRPRAELVEQLNKATKGAVAERAADIIEPATRIGMRREGEHEDYTRIDVAQAVFVIEGGANKTSVVRRGVAEKALHALFGEDISDKTVYQLGIGSMVDPKRRDGSVNLGHTTVTGLAAEFLPEGSFSEFEANLATALADGYVVTTDETTEELPGITRIVRLSHSDSSRPQLVQVMSEGKGLPGGLDAIAALESLEGRQLVIATNGQYRPKDELQAMTWAIDKGVTMLPPVALGDEPGDSWVYKGKTFETPPRPAAAYVNELAIYGRQTAEFMTREA